MKEVVDIFSYSFLKFDFISVHVLAAHTCTHIWSRSAKEESSVLCIFKELFVYKFNFHVKYLSNNFKYFIILKNLCFFHLLIPLLTLYYFLYFPLSQETLLSASFSSLKVTPKEFHLIKNERIRRNKYKKWQL